MEARGGSRIEWTDIPVVVRAAIEARLGAAVESATNEPGGFSPGLAARCELEDGRRVFVKAVSTDQNPHSPRIHRREAEVADLLTRRAPHALGAPLRAVIDDGHWVCLVFDLIEGRQPSEPWSMVELDTVMPALRAIGASVPPEVTAELQTFEARHGAILRGWRRLAGGDGDPSAYGPEVAAHVDRLAEIEEAWPAAAAGDALLHADLRADNMLLTADGDLAVVDWPHACRGAAFVDPVLMLCAIGLGGGPDPATVVERYGLADGVDPEAFLAVAAAEVGYFVRDSLEEPPVGLPRLRSFQRAQAEVGLRWLLALLR